eukprot:2106911-Rhodomonas_salina.4
MTPRRSTESYEMRSSTLASVLRNPYEMSVLMWCLSYSLVVPHHSPPVLCRADVLSCRVILGAEESNLCHVTVSSSRAECFCTRGGHALFEFQPSQAWGWKARQKQVTKKLKA